MTYLKDRSYYEDLYDWHTVQECRRWVNRIMYDKKIEKRFKSSSKKDQLKVKARLINLPLYFMKGNRYLHKKDFIDQLMASDSKKDDFIENTPEPNVFCPKCSNKMKLVIKDLKSTLDDENLRMLFLFRCDPCNEKKGLYDDGEPYIFKGDFCPKCNKEWEQKSIKSKDKIITKSHCPFCGHKEEYALDLSRKINYDEPDANFGIARKEFCLSEKEGEEYRRWLAHDYPQLKNLVEGWDDEKKHKEIYEKARNISKLTISQLSDLLSKELAKADYKGLVVTNTEITRDLIVTFSIQDTKVGRDEGHSRNDLRELLTKLLDNTNWKLMSEGVSYKLGLLTGRLRGVDQEEVLVNDIKAERGIK